MFRSVYSVSCSCSLMRNGNNIPLSGSGGEKQQRVHIYAALKDVEEEKEVEGVELSSQSLALRESVKLCDQEIFQSSRYDLTQVPFIQVESPSVHENLFRCGLFAVQKCNAILLNKGRLTIDILSGERDGDRDREDSLDRFHPTDLSLKNAADVKQRQKKNLTQLCLSEATPQTLKLFIVEVHQFVKLFTEESKKEQQSRGFAQPPASERRISYQTKYAQIQQKGRTIDPKAQPRNLRRRGGRRRTLGDPQVIIIDTTNALDQEEAKYIDLEQQQRGEELTLLPSTGELPISVTQGLHQTAAERRTKQQQQQQKVIELEIEDAVQREDDSQPMLPQFVTMMDIEGPAAAAAAAAAVAEADEGECFESCLPVYSKVCSFHRDRKVIDGVQESYLSSQEVQLEEDEGRNQSSLQCSSSSSLGGPLKDKQHQNTSSFSSSSIASAKIHKELSTSEHKHNQLEAEAEDNTATAAAAVEESANLTSESDSKERRIARHAELVRKARSGAQRFRESQIQQQASSSENMKEVLVIDDDDDEVQVEWATENSLLNKDAKCVTAGGGGRGADEGGRGESTDRKAAVNGREMVGQVNVSAFSSEASTVEDHSHLPPQASEEQLIAKKFTILQEKLQEIKQKKKEEKLMQRRVDSRCTSDLPVKRQTLYKVDKNQLMKLARAAAAVPSAYPSRALMKNPFSCEEETNEVITFSEEEFEQLRSSSSCESPLDGRGNVFRSTTRGCLKIYDDEEEDVGVAKSTTKNTSSCFEGQSIKMLQVLPRVFSFAGSKKIGDSVSVKKLGDRYICERRGIEVEQDSRSSRISKLSRMKESFCGSTMRSQRKMAEVIARVTTEVMGLIFSFFSDEERLGYRVVCRSFNEGVMFCQHRLVFRSGSDAPNERVVDLLNASRQLRELTLGNLRGLTASVLVMNWKVSQSATNLEKIDLQRYSNLTEKLLLMIVKHAAGSLKELLLPYFSRGVSDQTLLSVAETASDLQRLALKAKADNLQRNEKVSDEGLVRVLQKGENIVSFEVFTVSPKFFQCLEGDRKQESSSSSSSVLPRIERLKINNLVLTRSPDDEPADVGEKAIGVIGKMQNLTELKINNIVRKAKGEWFLPHTPAASTVACLFQGEGDALTGRSKIRRISFGNWCGNETLRVLSDNLSSVEHIRIVGNAVDDSGFEFILQKMLKLKSINIAQASRINGHCFEAMVSKRLKQIKVSFEDFRLNCLRSTLQTQLAASGGGGGPVADQKGEQNFASHVDILNYFK